MHHNHHDLDHYRHCEYSPSFVQRFTGPKALDWLHGQRGYTLLHLASPVSISPRKCSRRTRWVSLFRVLVYLADKESEKDGNCGWSQVVWRRRVDNYWDLMSSKVRPNTLRNIMDMRAHLGSFAAALHERDVWVMNVIPDDQQHHLKIVYDRGLIGSVHDWSVIYLSVPPSLSLPSYFPQSLSLHLFALTLSRSLLLTSHAFSLSASPLHYA